MAGSPPEPEDFKTFVRETVRRHEIASEAMIRRPDERRAEARERFDAQIAATLAQTAALRAHPREFVEEMRAQRAALFAKLDKLEGGEAGA